MGELSYQSAKAVSEDVISLFLDGELDEVFIVSTHFKSAISQDVVTDRLLPLASKEPGKGENIVEYIFEPSPKELLNNLLENHIVIQILRAMLDSVASEHGARMTAMGAATNNATDMIKRLTLIYNRARQATITTELVEIVSGAEALKGA